MNLPTWGYVVAIIMMLGGGCSLTKSVQAIYTPTIMEFQKDVLGGVADGFGTMMSDSALVESFDTSSTEESRAVTSELFSNLGDTMDKMLTISEFSKTWIVRFGYMGLVVSFVYILGGLFLVVPKHFSINLAYAVLGLSIVLSTVQAIVLSSDSEGGLVAMTAGFSQIFGILIDITLIIVIVASDKSVYQMGDTGSINPPPSAPQ